MPETLVVRRRRAGDRVRAFGMEAPRRLKALLIDAAVPRWERDRVPLLEAGDEIAWVAGIRRGCVAPVTADTRRILEVTLGRAVATDRTAE